MSYSYGKKSRERLETCHIDIQLIMNEVIKIYDVSVLEGHRSDEKQMEYFLKGLSKLDGINDKSEHQKLPSMAIDAMPRMAAILLRE